MGQYVFKMPDIGEGVVEAEITVWHVSVGDNISEDDPVADAMTDKATVELTAPVTGIVRSVGCEAGEILAVGAALVVIETEGEVEQPEPQTETSPKAVPKKQAERKYSKPPTAGKTIGKILASPAVRKRAKDAGINLEGLSGTGNSGQITQDDLDLLEKALEPQAGETRVKIIGLRRVIAERMQAAKRHIPHFTYVEEIDVTELDAFRRRANESRGEDKPKLTVLPFIIRAMILGIRDYPQVNARFHDQQGFLSQFEPVHLGIATQTDTGLVVPVMRHAQSQSVWEMASEIARLADGARNNTLSKDELTGATTTLTSLGSLGGIVTTPVINRPEVAIFGPNKIRPKLVLKDGAVKERLVMNFSISCDHRIIDGYDAASLMQLIKGLLEDPRFMFMN